MKVKMTQKLNGWLREKGLVQEGADAAALTAAAEKALADGTLDVDTYAELVREEKSTGASETLKALVDGQTAMAAAFAKLAEAVLKPKVEEKAKEEVEKTEPEPTATKVVETEEVDGEKHIPLPDIHAAMAKAPGTGLLSKGVNFKGAWKDYDSTPKSVHYPEFGTKGGRHPLAGQRVSEGIMGRTPGARYIDEPSDLERAASGAFMKFCLSRAGTVSVPRPLRMTDHDHQLVQWALHEAKWGGIIGGDSEGESHNAIHLNNEKLGPNRIKALIDDTVTGGLEAAPIFFDSNFILDPLLHSEILPMVNITPITRGRRIEATSFGNVTMQWGGGDEDATDLFDTTGFVTAFDTKIHVVDGAIELGLDLLSDSPLPIVDIVRAQYSERLLTTLDEQLAHGDGVQEPEGVFVTTGVTTVAFGAAHTVGNYEGLLFGVAKRFKKGQDASRTAFLGTETSYSRARGIPVGAADARRIFGLTEEDYMLFGHKWSVNDVGANTDIAYVVWSRYRLYRRLGLTVRSTGEGKELLRKNLWLISARSRWGGKLEASGAMSKTTTASA